MFWLKIHGSAATNTSGKDPDVSLKNAWFCSEKKCLDKVRCFSKTVRFVATNVLSPKSFDFAGRYLTQVSGHHTITHNHLLLRKFCLNEPHFFKVSLIHRHITLEMYKFNLWFAETAVFLYWPSCCCIQRSQQSSCWEYNVIITNNTDVSCNLYIFHRDVPSLYVCVCECERGVTGSACEAECGGPRCSSRWTSSEEHVERGRCRLGFLPSEGQPEGPD